MSAPIRESDLSSITLVFDSPRTEVSNPKFTHFPSDDLACLKHALQETKIHRANLVAKERRQKATFNKFLKTIESEFGKLREEMHERFRSVTTEVEKVASLLDERNTILFSNSNQKET